MLTREVRFTETRPIEAWSLLGIEHAIHEAIIAAREAGAPLIPERVSLQVTPPHVGLPNSVASLYTQVTWGTAIDGE